MSVELTVAAKEDIRIHCVIIVPRYQDNTIRRSGGELSAESIAGVARIFRIPATRAPLSRRLQPEARSLPLVCPGSRQAGRTIRGSPIPAAEICTSRP